MQNLVQDLSILDVFEDRSKNLCNLIANSDEDDDDTTPDLCDSLYYTETEFVETINVNEIQNEKYITIVSLNIANLLSKLRFLKIFIKNITTGKNQPDIIVIVETHLSKSTNSGLSKEELKHILPGYYLYHKGREQKKGGGVGVFVSDRLNSEVEILEIARYQEEVFENIVIKIPNTIATNNKNCTRDLVLAAIYRQPNNSNVDTFTRELEKLIKNIDKRKNEVVIAGDMNLDLLKYDYHPATGNYLDIMTQHKFLPMITRPTRIKHQSATLIDHLFMKDNGNHIKSGIIDTEIAGNCGYTDHFPIFTILKSKLQMKKSNESIQKCYFTQKNHADRKQNLLKEDWSGILELNDANAIYDQMLAKYSKHYHENKTTRTFTKRSNRHSREPWMTSDILADIRRRDRLAKKKDRREDYRKLRNEIVSKIRRAEKEYLKAQIESSIGNAKKHWKVLRDVTNKTNNKAETVSAFYYKGALVEDPQENAENMNEYQANIGRETNESVGPSNCSASSYLEQHKERNIHEMLFHDVSPSDIIEACKKFTPKTSCDATGIQQNIVLSDIGILAPVLAHLVNVSQSTGVFPEGGKIARLIPVYKNKGSKKEFGNYRPVSLLPVFSKIMERLIYNKVFEFLVRYQILFESQYGFRKGHNTTHAILDFIKTIEEAIEQNQYAIGIFCDLSKAFDTLNHEILLLKLDHYGIRGKANEWFRSYLKDRKQYAELNNCKSSCLTLTTGVPQGSILGPLLFLIYINDLPSAAKLKSVQFADDSNLLIKGDDLRILTQTLTKELESVCDFFKANQLKLNANKTKMVFFRKKSLPANYSEMEVYLDGVKLALDDHAEFLGTTIDCTLSWEQHCTKVANKISQSNGMLSRVKHLLPASSLRLLYHSFIQPHIQYALPAWGGCTAQNKKRIINIQKRAIRTITKSYHTAHTEPRMKELGLLKFEDLYNIQTSTLIHDCYYGLAPLNVENCITSAHNSNHSLRNQTNKSFDLHVPMRRSRAGSNSFIVNGPQMWNQIPSEVRSISQKERFKKAIKRVTLRSYDEKITCTNPRCKDYSNHSCIS